MVAGLESRLSRAWPTLIQFGQVALGSEKCRGFHPGFRQLRAIWGPIISAIRLKPAQSGDRSDLSLTAVGGFLNRLSVTLSSCLDCCKPRGHVSAAWFQPRRLYFRMRRLTQNIREGDGVQGKRAGCVKYRKPHRESVPAAARQPPRSAKGAAVRRQTAKKLAKPWRGP